MGSGGEPLTLAVDQPCRCPAIATGRLPVLPPERPVERRLRFVAHAAGNLENALTRCCKHACPQLQAPSREIGHRRLVEVVAKPFGERRTRRACLTRKRAEGPAS